MMDKEKLANEFMKEYEELCDKYKMELDMFDVWDTETYTIEIYDREEGKFILLE